jgi:hypothetical protein
VVSRSTLEFDRHSRRGSRDLVFDGLAAMSATVEQRSGEDCGHSKVYAIRVVKVENGRSRCPACGQFFLHALDCAEYLSEVLTLIEPDFLAPADGLR